MIEYRKGNLLDVTSGVIAHGVNCQGVMGSGVALAIRKKYPHVFDLYKEYCQRSVVSKTSALLGHVQFVSSVYVEGTWVSKEAPLVIANCFTQDFYGKDKRHVNYEAVAKCFQTLYLRSGMYGQLNIPKIGAGLAGGDWNVIEAIINSEYKDDVIVWELG